MKSNKGITLIALVVTIIILLILAGVSISSMKENGFFSNVGKSAIKHKISEYDELIKLAITESHFEEFNTSRENLEAIQEILKKNKNFEGANFRIGKYDQNESLIIITKEKYVFIVTGTQVKYIGTEEEINDIPTLIEANIDFEYTPNKWTNGNVLVKILINNAEYKNYKIEYSYDLKNWAIYEKEIEVTENDTTIYARITNELVSAEEYATRTISIIDRDEPAMIDISKSEVTWSGSAGKVTITGKAKDELSGISEYQFSKDGNIIESSSGWQAIEPTKDEIMQMIDVTTEGTWYFYVKDQAGNVNKNSIEISIGDTTAPNISLTLNTTSTTNSVTLTGKSRDTGSGIIAYGWTSSASQPTGTTTTGELGKWTSIKQTTSEISQSITLNSNGTRYFWTKDGVGNVNVASHTVSNIVAKVNISSYDGITLLRGNSGTPTLNYSGTPKQKAFSSNNTNIASVDSSGRVTAKTTAGTANITVVLTNYDNTTVSKSCTVTVNNGVATIGSVDYSTVQNAINSTSNATILLNWSTTESVTINSGKTITLNLNGQTLTGTDNSNDGSAAIYTYGNTTVYNGTVTGANAINIGGGTLNVTGGTINGNTNRGILASGGTINIKNNPTITGTRGINGGGGSSNININVDGGNITSTTYEAISIAGNSNINIKGGNLTGKTDGILAYENSNSTITISGGLIIGESMGIISYASGTINVNGGFIKANTNAAVYSRNATININGGESHGTNFGVITENGTVNMNNGTVRGWTYDGIKINGGSVYLRQGTVIGVNWAVYAPGGIVYYKNSAPYISLTSSNNLWDNGRYALYAVNYQNI